MFVGRSAELEMLERAYSSERSEFVVIYGRRRIGKSELILRFAKDKRALYYLGKTASAPLQQRELLGEAARLLGEPLLASLEARDWKQVLLSVVERHRGGGKLVVALDEFQWMAGASPELPSVIQECWDRHWRSSGKVMLVLCGSFVGFMEREVLGKRSPLFGRRTAQILLRPFTYDEAVHFHPRWAMAERARVYFVCGGVPLYLLAFQAELSVEQNIERNLLNEFAPLFQEPDFLLREELREIEGYFGVLRAIAAGATSSNAIAGVSGLPERSLHYYLQQLSELGYVGRRHPLGDGKPNRRSVRYLIEDPLLRFWFRFVFPNQSAIRQAGAHRVFRERIRPELEAYFGSCFERLCREALPQLYRKEGVSASFEIGQYWDQRVQIDVVGRRDDRFTDLGECKWGPPGALNKLAADLEQRAALYPNRRGASLGLRLFVRDTPTKDSQRHYRVHSLADLYAAAR